MRSLLLVRVAAAMCIAAPAKADDTAEALAVVQKFASTQVRAEYASYCAPDAVYVDHLPPYVFRGPTACQDEWDAAEAYAPRHKITQTNWGKITEPSYVEADAGRVYAVYPVTATQVRDGKREVEEALWAFVLQRGPQGWR